MDHAAASPRVKARIAGLFYLLTFLTGAVAVPGFKLVVSGNAAATAANILAHQPLFLLGFAAFVVNVACYIAVTALFYDLFKPVNRSVSALAAFFSLVGCAVQAAACLFPLATLAAVEGPPYLSGFKPEQLQALGYMFLELHSKAYDVGLIFFGFYCVLIGYLVLRSTFLPRVLGGLMIFAGLGWLTFLWPPLADHLSPYILAPGILGEGALTLWLLIMGVNAERWKQQAGAASAGV